MLLTRHRAEIACPSCDATWPSADARFCGSCGTRLVPGHDDRRPPRGRRPVARRGPLVAVVALALLGLVVALTELPVSRAIFLADHNPGTVALPSGPAAVAAPGGAGSPSATAERPEIPRCRSVRGGDVECAVWSTGFPVSASPSTLVLDDRVLVAPDDATVRSVDVVAGAVDWSVGFRGFTRLEEPVLTTDRRLLVPVVHAASVTLLDVDRGETLWTRDNVGGFVGVRDVLPAGDVVLVASGQRVLALDVASGETRWSQRPEGSFTLTRAGVVVVRPDELRLLDPESGETAWALVVRRDELRLLDPASGEVAWALPGPPPPLRLVGTARFGDTTLYVAAGDGRLLAVDASSGEPWWTSEPLIAAPTLVTAQRRPGPNPAVVAVATTERHGVPAEVVVLNDHDGRVRWRQPLPDGYAAGVPPAVTDDLVVVARSAVSAPSVAAYDLRTGEQRWSLEPFTTAERLAVTSDLVLVTTGQGIAAHDLDSGGVEWRLPLPGAGLVDTDPLIVTGRDQVMRIDVVTLPLVTSGRGFDGGIMFP